MDAQRPCGIGPRRAGRRSGVAGMLVCVAVMTLTARADFINLGEIDPGTTSPDGTYRWLDVANQAYSEGYRTSYAYSQAGVQVDFRAEAAVLRGTLTAANLKPNFAYQLKLVGTPGTAANEGIGLSGRWWEESWNGSEWANGHNLNNKGDGASPNPNDLVYLDRRDILDATSPTGYKYRYTAYLVLGYYVTDGNGNAVYDFAADSSYHVLWKTTQLSYTPDDGPPVVHTFDPDPAVHPAYDVDYGENTVTVFGEWERLPVGGVLMRLGEYSARMILTEESFHGDGAGYVGNWAAAMGGDIVFTIVSKGDFDADGSVDFWDFMDFVEVYGLSESDSGWEEGQGWLGDFDDDGWVDFWDFMAFVAVYGL